MMNVHRISRGVRQCISIFPFLTAPLAAIGSDSEAVLVAKGCNVISITVPTEHEVSTFDLAVSFDGETYHDCSVGLPRAWQLFYSISHSEQHATITVPVVAGFGAGVEQFLFREAGRRWFRWKIVYEAGLEPTTIDQAVVVVTSSQADLDFIAGLGDPDLARYIFGEDFFERQTGVAREHIMDPEVRALKVIGVVLQATRAEHPGGAVRRHKSEDALPRCGDTLLALAKGTPESSYAPYAAYYAGCCYLVAVGDALEEMMKSNGIKDHALRERDAQTMFTFVKENRYYRKAEEALRVAAAHADRYLKPRAIFMQASVPALTGAWDDAERLLREAREAAPGEVTIQRMVDRAQRGIADAKERVTRGERGED